LDWSREGQPRDKTVRPARPVKRKENGSEALNVRLVGSFPLRNSRKKGRQGKKLSAS